MPHADHAEGAAVRLDDPVVGHVPDVDRPPGPVAIGASLAAGGEIEIEDRPPALERITVRRRVEVPDALVGTSLDRTVEPFLAGPGVDRPVVTGTLVPRG